MEYKPRQDLIDAGWTETLQGVYTSPVNPEIEAAMIEASRKTLLGRIKSFISK